MATKQPNKTTASKKKQTKKVASTAAANVGSEGVVIDKLNAVLAWIKRNPAPFLLIVTLLVGLLWFGYVSYVKWQFSQAEKEVGRLSTAIIDELGTPQSTDTLKSCSYKSEKYAYGQTDAMCSVGYSATYSGDSNYANTIANVVKTVVSKYYDLSYASKGSYTNGVDSSDLNSATNTFDYSNFDCGTIVRYSTNNPDNKQEVELYISCGKKVNFYRIYPDI
jgi:hypothetical protein